MGLKLTSADKSHLPTCKMVSCPNLYSVEIAEGIEDEQIIKFAKQFFKQRGINRPKIYSCMFAEFKHVGMHVDNLSPLSSATMIVMLKGHGELAYVKSEHIGEKSQITGAWNTAIGYKTLKTGDIFCFNFHMPHSFVCKLSSGSCFALLIDVDREQLKSAGATELM